MSSEKPSRTILVVDDNRDVAETLATLIGLFGFKTETCYTGAAAVEYIGTHEVDMVFLDIGMPGMDGYHTAQAMRRLPGHQPTIVAVTGFTQSEDRARSSEAGFDYHLNKPIDMGELERLLGISTKG